MLRGKICPASGERANNRQASAQTHDSAFRSGTNISCNIKHKKGCKPVFGLQNGVVEYKLAQALQDILLVLRALKIDFLS